MPKDVKRYSTDTVWEAIGGYSRAIRFGMFIFVSGTSVTEQEVQEGIGEDPAEQTRSILNKIEIALEKLGASREDVIKTRIYIRELRHWESACGRSPPKRQRPRPVDRGPHSIRETRDPTVEPGAFFISNRAPHANESTNEFDEGNGGAVLRGLRDRKGLG